MRNNIIRNSIQNTVELITFLDSVIPLTKDSNRIIELTEARGEALKSLKTLNKIYDSSKSIQVPKKKRYVILGTDALNE